MDGVQETKVLAVDLDGTLIRSDMLFEAFWAALATRWDMGLRAARAWRARGRAGLKAALAEAAPLDPAALPYDQTVLDQIRTWRAGGGQTALVTAADQTQARAIAAHLGLFDRVIASDGQTNLKGPAKAQALAQAFGADGYTYMGDSTADLAIWATAPGITVGANAAMRARAEAAGPHPITHIAPPAPVWRAALRAMRPHQWLKNTLVLVPMVTAHQVTGETLLISLAAFVAFSLIASGIYLINDLLDLAADRAHARKKHRPLASGALPIRLGTGLAPVLLLAGLGLGWALGPVTLVVLLGYLALTTAYSLHLKRKLIIDICALAGLYTLRLFAGGAATDIALSTWLLAFSIFFFFALAAVKRQAELVDLRNTGGTRAPGREYQVDDLMIVTAMALASGYLSVLVMALYLSAPEVNALYPQPFLLLGICPVLLYWISRMVMLTHRGVMTDDPILFAVDDRTSYGCLGLIGLSISAAAWG